MSFFFFNDTATTEIYTLSLHDALPIWLFTDDLRRARGRATRESTDSLRSTRRPLAEPDQSEAGTPLPAVLDRKSTRLNSSHANISYAVFCLKKKTSSTARYTIVSVNIS